MNAAVHVDDSTEPRPITLECVYDFNVFDVCDAVKGMMASKDHEVHLPNWTAQGAPPFTTVDDGGMHILWSPCLDDVRSAAGPPRS